MKLHNKNWGLIAAVCIYIFVVLDNHLFYLVKESELLAQILYKQNIYIMIGCSSFILFIYYKMRYRKFLYQYTRWVTPYFFILVIVLTGLIIFTTVQYPLQKIINTLQAASGFSVIFMAVPVMVVFIRHNGTEKFMKFMNIVAIIWYVLLLVQRFALLTTGSYLFAFNNYSSENFIAGRSKRIVMPIWANIMILYDFVKIYAGIIDKKIYKLYILQFVLGMFCMIFISQTRGYILAVMSSILVIIFLGKKPASFKVKEIILMFLLAVAVFFSDIIPEFISIFSVNVERGGSTSIRLYEIQYYWECFCNNPVFGNGLAGYGPYSYVQNGNYGVAWYDDVGIIGLMAQTGVCAVVIYIAPLIHMIKLARQIYKKSADKEVSFFSIGIVFYLLVSSATLIITDIGRVVVFPIIYAYLEYHNIQEKSDQKIRAIMNKILAA